MSFWWSYTVLNLVQSFTEFLPISSSSHLLLLKNYLGITEADYLVAVLHFPTVLAVALFFFKDWLEIVKTPKKWPIIAVSFVPAGIVGFFLKDFITTYLDNNLVIGLNQLIWGVIFVLFNKVFKEAGEKSEEDLSLKQAFYIGIAQVFSLIPGTSRSGITMFAGVMLGLNSKVSARFSLMSGLPLTAAAALLGIKNLISEKSLFVSEWQVILIGSLLSLLLSLVFIKMLLSRKIDLVYKISGFYRILLGLFILIISL